MNNDNKVETAIAGLNCWASYATDLSRSHFHDTKHYSFSSNPYKFELSQLITSNVDFLARYIARGHSPQKTSFRPTALGMLSSGHAPRVVSR